MEFHTAYISFLRAEEGPSLLMFKINEGRPSLGKIIGCSKSTAIKVRFAELKSIFRGSTLFCS